MKLSERQLTRAIYSTWDIQQALSALTFLLEGCDFDAKYNNVDLRRFRCYETTLIISLARPFESTRNGTTLGLKALGIKLNTDENKLIDKVLHLRRKIIAHSDEEQMHFRSSTFSVLDGEFNIPHLQFNEGLHFEEPELRQLEQLLLKLKHDMATFLFQLAQKNPGILEAYKEPGMQKGNSSKNA